VLLSSGFFLFDQDVKVLRWWLDGTKRVRSVRASLVVGAVRCEEQGFAAPESVESNSTNSNTHTLTFTQQKKMKKFGSSE
jgi:hypothetical protein